MEPEWWRETEPNCATITGSRTMPVDASGVYRAGLYQQDRAPRWYLHGVFP